MWVKLKDQTKKGHLVVGAYYRLLDHGDPAHEAFLLQLEETSCSQTLLMGDFNHLNICWESNCVGLAWLDFWLGRKKAAMEVIFCEKLLEASSVPGKTNHWLALRIGTLLSLIEKLVMPL